MNLINRYFFENGVRDYTGRFFKDNIGLSGEGPVRIYLNNYSTPKPSISKL